jgi:hypothetical protein
MPHTAACPRTFQTTLVDDRVIIGENDNEDKFWNTIPSVLGYRNILSMN